MSLQPAAESSPEWVTLQEAADDLGLSTRQVSRLVSRLPPDDVRRSPGRPTTCRLEALRVLRHDAGHSRPEARSTDDKPKTPTRDIAQSVAGHDAGHGLGQGAYQEGNDAGHVSDLVTELRAELARRDSDLESVKQDREHWRGQAEKALQLVDQAQQLQLVAERKVAELEGKLLPAGIASELRPVEQKDQAGRADGSQGDDKADERPVQPQDTSRPFWARLWKRGG